MDRKHGTAAMELSVNEYELERDKRIARNLDALKRLGLTSTASDGLTAKMSTFQLLQPAKLAQRPPKLLQHQPEAQDLEPTRVSKRLRGSDAPSLLEITNAISEEAAAQQRAASKSGSRRGIALTLDGAPVHLPFTLRSIGTTVWAIGQIHRGPWAQRYWSNTGCLHHHAYPIGYQASKVQFGRTYNMSIAGGPQGPIFTVTEEGAPGRSFSGTSPTSPWTEVCLSQRTGQRISGPLFFGFSDVITMRAISALYNPTELAAALQGQRVGNNVLTAAEKAAQEFQTIEGIGESTAMALALTEALGGRQLTSLAALHSWAGTEANCRALQQFLLYSEEIPVATRRWPAWSARLVPKILHAICGPAADSICVPPAPGRSTADASDQRQPRARALPQQAAAQAQAKRVDKGNPRIAGARRSNAHSENLKAVAGSNAQQPLLRLSRHRTTNRKFADYVLLNV